MDLNNLEIFKSTVASGKTAVGVVVSSPDACVSEVAAMVGLDFIWIDMEHAPTSHEAAMHHVMTLRGSRTAPFIRVPTNEQWVIKKVIDFAPAGIIVPMVNTAEDARRAVAACRYPTVGGDRGVGVRRAVHYGGKTLQQYLDETATSDPMVILQIEHRQAVENLDEILAVPGWDSVCIGPCDLTTSYMKPNRFDDPEIKEVMRTIFRKVSASDKMLGGFLPDWCLPEGDFHLDWRAFIGDYETLAESWRALAIDSRRYRG